MRDAEASHCILFGATLGVVVHAAARGWWTAAGLTLLFDVLTRCKAAAIRKVHAGGMTTTAGAMVDAVVGRFLACITDGRGHELGSLYTDDATADMTVPNWRFGVDGPEDISREYARWFADPGRFDELEVRPVPGGVVVRYLLSWEEDGVPHSAHHCHVLEIDGRLIRRDTVFCGGRWPADLLAKMTAARER